MPVDVDIVLFIVGTFMTLLGSFLIFRFRSFMLLRELVGWGRIGGHSDAEKYGLRRYDPEESKSDLARLQRQRQLMSLVQDRGSGEVSGVGVREVYDTSKDETEDLMLGEEDRTGYLSSQAVGLLQAGYELGEVVSGVEGAIVPIKVIKEYSNVEF